MLEDTLKETECYSKAKNQNISLLINQSIPEKLIGDEKRLEQLILNLISNAIKFTPDGGNIDVSACLISEDDKKCTVQIDVKDNGVGIPKEEQKGIFDIFEQVDGSETRTYDGIGIGLALSKRIVEMMGGTIKVDSEPGKGTTFSFTCKLGKVV